MKSNTFLCECVCLHVLYSIVHGCFLYICVCVCVSLCSCPTFITQPCCFLRVLQDDVSGDYRRLMMALVGGMPWAEQNGWPAMISTHGDILGSLLMWLFNFTLRMVVYTAGYRTIKDQLILTVIAWLLYLRAQVDEAVVESHYTDIIMTYKSVVVVQYIFLPPFLLHRACCSSSFLVD